MRSGPGFTWKEIRFAEKDGCTICVGVAYDAFPKMVWIEFCAAYSESQQVKKAFDLARKIFMKEVSQPFKVRGSVEALNLVGIELERRYTALTSEEVLSLFQLPPEAFEDSLRSVTLNNEDGDACQFFLFETDGVGRTARLFSRHTLQHSDHLVEAEKVLRKEQPLERFQMMVKDEVASRSHLTAKAKSDKKGSSSNVARPMTISEAKAKAAAIIKTREEAETNDNAKPSAAVEAEPQLDLEEVERVTTSLNGLGVAAKAPAPKKRTGNPKAGSRAKRARGASPEKENPAQTSILALGGNTASSAAGPAAAASMSTSSAEGLAAVIKSKIGGDVKSLKNLDVVRVLQGEALGRSLVGATWLAD